MDLPLQANSCNINCQNLFVTKQSPIKNVIACDYQEMNANIAFCYLDAIIPLLDLNFFSGDVHDMFLSLLSGKISGYK